MQNNNSIKVVEETIQSQELHGKRDATSYCGTISR